MLAGRGSVRGRPPRGSEMEAELIEKNEALAAYLDNSGRDDRLSGGVKMIPIQTPKGTFHVWTKRAN